MIDWISCSIPYLGPPIGTQILEKCATTGVVEPKTFRGKVVEGSYSSKLLVQVAEQKMYISVNPSKFLTGQNLVGTDDIWLLIRHLYESVLDHFGAPDCIHARTNMDHGKSVILHRVDCTFNFQMNNERDVHDWLREFGQHCSVKHRGRASYDEGMASAYFGLTVKNGKTRASRRSIFKFYSKATEVKKRPFNTYCQHTNDRLNERVEGVLRGEAGYRFLELNRLGYGTLDRWTKKTSKELFTMWLERMEVNQTTDLNATVLDGLTPKQQMIYDLWRSGKDTRQYVSKASFYRYRSVFSQHGVDLCSPPPSVKHNQEQTKKRVVEVLIPKMIDHSEEEQFFFHLLRAS